MVSSGAEWQTQDTKCSGEVLFPVHQKLEINDAPVHGVKRTKKGR